MFEIVLERVKYQVSPKKYGIYAQITETLTQPKSFSNLKVILYIVKLMYQSRRKHRLYLRVHPQFK